MNAVITRHYMNLAGKGTVSFSESLIAGLGMLLAWEMDFTRRVCRHFEQLVFFLAGSCILAAVMYSVHGWKSRKNSIGCACQNLIKSLQPRSPYSIYSEDDKISTLENRWMGSFLMGLLAIQ